MMTGPTCPDCRGSGFAPISGPTSICEPCPTCSPVLPFPSGLPPAGFQGDWPHAADDPRTVGPFPQEPALGSPEAVEQAAETIRGFTPGPWAAVPHDPGELRLKRRFWQIGQEHEPNKGVGFAFGEDDANARLIASAPDLLAEVERLRAEREGDAEIRFALNAAGLQASAREEEALRQRDTLADALESLLLETGALDAHPPIGRARAVGREALRKAGRLP